jgi:hypothetical protein
MLSNVVSGAVGVGSAVLSWPSADQAGPWLCTKSSPDTTNGGMTVHKRPGCPQEAPWKRGRRRFGELAREVSYRCCFERRERENGQPSPCSPDVSQFSLPSFAKSAGQKSLHRRCDSVA